MLKTKGLGETLHHSSALEAQAAGRGGKGSGVREAPASILAPPPKPLGHVSYTPSPSFLVENLW